MNQNPRDDVACNNWNPILVVDYRDRAIREYVLPMFSELNKGIVKHEI